MQFSLEKWKISSNCQICAKTLGELGQKIRPNGDKSPNLVTLDMPWAYLSHFRWSALLEEDLWRAQLEDREGGWSGEGQRPQHPPRRGDLWLHFSHESRRRKVSFQPDLIQMSFSIFSFSLDKFFSEQKLFTLAGFKLWSLYYESRRKNASFEPDLIRKSFSISFFLDKFFITKTVGFSGIQTHIIVAECNHTQH